MASMRTRTEYNFDSLVELQRVVSRNLTPKETLRQKAFCLAWGACCLGMGAYMVSHGYNAFLALLLLIPGVFMLVRYVFFYQLLAWGACRKLKADQQANDFYFEDDHILARQNKDSAKYPYDQCARLLETPGYFYFIMNNGQGLMLDKANIKGGSADELRAFLEEKSGKSAENVKAK